MDNEGSLDGLSYMNKLTPRNKRATTPVRGA